MGQGFIGKPSRVFSEEEYPHKELTEAIIKAAIAVHRELGPGFIEDIYENALCIELQADGHRILRQQYRKVFYRGQEVGEHRFDVLVDDLVLVELKSVEALAPVHAAQLRSTLKAAGKVVGLLINFNNPVLVKGVQRVIRRPV